MASSLQRLKEWEYGTRAGRLTVSMVFAGSAAVVLGMAFSDPSSTNDSVRSVFATVLAPVIGVVGVHRLLRALRER
jgi:hypothetical protein